MYPEPTRVIYENQPYIVVHGADGRINRAYGPMSPGTEPSLEACRPELEVTDEETLAALESLVPVSPMIPSNRTTLAGSVPFEG